MQMLEDEHIPVDIPREYTYSVVDSYVADILNMHDDRLRHQPNVSNNLADGLYQMAALTMMKTTSSHSFRRDLRQGPFVLCLTDLHQSNIFVDDEWNVSCLIDLEWACSRPLEMVHPPYWLTSQAPDETDAEEYGKLHDEFMEMLEDEEKKSATGGPGNIQLSAVLRQAWETGTFWFVRALGSPTGLFSLFYHHIQPRFAKEHKDDAKFLRNITSYWTPNAKEFVKAKLSDKEQYNVRLGEAFGNSPAGNQ